MATLTDGQWFMYPVDDGIPEQVTIYSGEVTRRKPVQKITRYQAMALARWHHQGGIYYSYQDGAGRWHDVYVVGDVDAWFGDE